MSARPPGDRLRVLCAGDRFITADALADAARAALGADTATVTYETEWPDVPFGAFDGVREASGEPRRLAQLIGGASAVLTHLAPITAQVIDAAPELQVIGVTRGGPVNVDLTAATARGIPVLFLPGRNLEAVAQFVIGAMITLCRNIATAAPQLAAGTWDARYYRYELTGPELSSCTVGLVGLGAIGTRVAHLLRAFGTRVLFHDPYAPRDAARAAGAEAVSLEELLRSSDLVSVHARLTDQTRKMFDADLFNAMKPGARFINTARGELVDQGALLAALESGRLAGAALDVFDPEPPDPRDPLLARPDVLATPHIAGASQQVAADSVRRISSAVARFVATGETENCANPLWTAAAGERRGVRG